MNPFLSLLLPLIGASLVRIEPVRPLYPVARTVARDLLGGDAGEWARAAVVEWGEAPYRTRFRALASAAGLWARFDADDVNPWHTLGERDDPLWSEEVVEIFIDPDGDGRWYAEIEVNPANVVCDLLMERGAPDPRGDLEWDFQGLRSAVAPRPVADGLGEGWSATLFMPWDGFADLPETSVALPPREGDRWRFNIFRIKRPHGPAEPKRDVILEAWSPVTGRSFHVPDVFAEMVFQ